MMIAARASLVAATVLALGGLDTTQAVGENTGSCNVQALRGTFAYSGQFLALFPPPSTPPAQSNLVGAYTPVAVAGTVTFNGDGTMDGADVVNLGFGGIPRTYSGTYAVDDAENCGFAIEFTPVWSLPPATFHFHAVLARDGKVVQFVQTDPGSILAFSGERR